MKSKAPAGVNHLLGKAISESIIIFRFGFVGGISTLIHILVVWLLLSNDFTEIIAANAIAYLLAFSFSFAGNCFWTFRVSSHRLRAMLRFFLISVSGFGLNNGTLLLIMESEYLSPLTCAVFASAIIPVFSFLASRFWGFRQN